MHKKSMASPRTALAWMQTCIPWLFRLGLILSIAGLIWGAGFAPPDYQQGHTVRIMYVHVPSSWLALAIYTVMAGLGVVYWGWKSITAFYLARAAAPVGLTFTAVSLITGSLWGKPMWGTWWVWDARLTSMLLLLFIYLGYIVIVDSDQRRDRAAKIGALYSVVGALNIPIIKWSVNWWATLHQPASVIRWGSPTIHPKMLGPLLCVALGFTVLTAALIFMRACVLIDHQRQRRQLLENEPI